MNQPPTQPETDRFSANRRLFLQQLSVLAGGSCLAFRGEAQTAANPFTVAVPPSALRPNYQSDVGSMWATISRIGSRSVFPYAFTQDGFTDLLAWKQGVRMRLGEMLSHFPGLWPPQANKVSESDKG
ncbi:MAG: hypothetical protein ACO3VS_12820, partial [Limisphaerales bacterium]